MRLDFEIWRTAMIKKTVFSILFSSFLFTSFAIAAESIPTIRWVLAHEPADLFKEAADNFAKEVGAQTKGEIKVEVLTVAEYAKKYNQGQTIDNGDVIRKIQSGDIEMSQTYTTTLGFFNPDLYVLDLPFLFRNHDHAQKVLEGRTGERLLAGLTEKGIRGLAFTYSGGYRIIPSKKALSKIEDFKGLKLRTSSSPVAQDIFHSLGATPVPGTLDDVAIATKRGEIEGTESTYVRFYAMRQNEQANYLNDTGHSLFLTSIVVSDQFWKKVPDKYHSVLRQAAFNAARIERQHSIEGAEVTKGKCKNEGIPIVSFSKKEEERFRTATQGLYKKYQNYFSSDYIAQIRNQ